MYIFTFFMVIILCRWEMAHSAACNCGLGRGVNPCKATSCGIIGSEENIESGQPFIVRPQILPVIDVGTVSKPRVICKTIGGLQPLKPIGNLCSCEKTIVKPAVVPRPCASCISRALASSQNIRETINIDSSGETIRFGASGDTLQIGPSGETIQIGSSGDIVQIDQSGETIQIGSSGDSIQIDPIGETIQIGSSGDIVRIDQSGETIQIGENGETIQISPSGQTIKISQPVQPSSVIEIDQNPLGIQYPICGLPVLPKAALEVPQVPADAVSIELALKKQQQQNAIAVDRQLAYGFKTLPKEIPCAPKPLAFPEETLYTVNGQVLELKTLSSSQSVDEEAIEALEEQEEEEEEAEVVAPAAISLGSLGYGPASVQSGQFVNVEGTESADISSSDGYVHLCKDGFRSGEVVIKGGPVNSQVVLPHPPQPVCLDNEPQGACVYRYSQSSSSKNLKNQISNLLIKRLSGRL